MKSSPDSGKAGIRNPGRISDSGVEDAAGHRKKATVRGIEVIRLNESILTLGSIDDLKAYRRVKEGLTTREFKARNQAVALWTLAGLLIMCVLTVCTISIISALHGDSGSVEVVMQVVLVLLGMLGAVVGYLFGKKSKQRQAQGVAQ